MSKKIPFMNLDDLKVVDMRKVLTEFKISGWTKDRTRKGLMKKIKENMEPPPSEIENPIPAPRRKKQKPKPIP